MNPIKLLIVDDEPLARTGMQQLLQREADFSVVGLAENGRRALAMIEELAPDAVFLDVQMPDMSGIEMLELIPPSRRPIVIFVTAFDEFAIRAFDLNAVDYLVKPFTNARLARALERIRSLARSRGAAGIDDGLQQLVQFLHTQRAPSLEILPQRVVVKADRDLTFLEYDDIIWIEGQGDYVKFHAGKSSLLSRETMTHLEQRLDPAHFIRVHKSALVNLAKVRKLTPIAYGDHVLEMEGGTRVRVGRAFRDKIAAVFSDR